LVKAVIRFVATFSNLMGNIAALVVLMAFTCLSYAVKCPKC
jgi:hypothetical protein